MISSAWTCRYSSISSLRQRPMNILMLISNPEQIIAMDHVEQGHQVETSLVPNPTFGPQNLTAGLRFLNIIVGVIFFTSLAAS